jgi:hypothetical protein
MFLMIDNMKNLQIKNESLPQRCEICHQQDYFDALNNYCGRCSSIATKDLFKDGKYIANNDPQLKIASDYPLDSTLLVKIILTPFLLLVSITAWANLFSEHGVYYIKNILLSFFSILPFILLPFWLIFFAPKKFSK